jgi:UDP-3-O-[3-hydroxymyristoyl] glucosamine N-acyltransferase
LTAQTTAHEIADLLGVPRPARNVAIDRVSSVDKATSESVVFATDEAMLEMARASPAGLILAGENAIGEQILAVKSPRTAFARVYREWFEFVASKGFHPSAVIHPDAVIGPDCEIGAGCVIEADTRLGARCRLGARVTIHAGTSLGERVRVQSGAVLGSTGFGYVREAQGHMRFPQIGTLWIGDDVEIGANTTIDRGALGETRIGQGTKIDNLVHIAHNCVIGERVLMVAQVGLAGSITVEDDAILGGQVGLGEKVTIGRGVILGGQGGVLPGKTLEGPGQIFWGTPARPVREYLRDLARLRRR